MAEQERCSPSVAVLDAQALSQMSSADVGAASGLLALFSKHSNQHSKTSLLLESSAVSHSFRHCSRRRPQISSAVAIHRLDWDPHFTGELVAAEACRLPQPSTLSELHAGRAQTGSLSSTRSSKTLCSDCCNTRKHSG